MLDFSHIPENGNADIQTFIGTSTSTGSSTWQTWHKPRGKSMCHIWMVGKGGNGGNGFVGVASGARSGGGGGAGSLIQLIVPLYALPDTLFLSLGGAASPVMPSYITTYPSIVPVHTLAYAGSGGAGGNATATVVGAAGTGAVAPSAANMPLGWAYKVGPVIAGAAGTAGTGLTTVAYTSTLLVTGNVVFGGTGGAAVQAAGVSGTAGGSIPANGAYPAYSYTNAAISATIPGTNGPSALAPIPGLRTYYGGLGGGSSNGSATTTGLFGGNGGDGYYGSGGGGGAGCLTGGVAGTGGNGGPGVAIITCW